MTEQSNGYGFCTLCGIVLLWRNITACQEHKLLGIYCSDCMYAVLSQCMCSSENETYE